MRGVAAAPLLLDDPPVASPELALVDAGLAAQLRAELTSGGVFRPREVARPAYLTLLVDAAPEPEPAPDDELSPVQFPPVEVIPAYLLPHENADDLPLVDEVPSVADTVEFPVSLVAAGEDEELPDYVVRADDPIVAREVTAETSAAEQAQASSDYPVLPDLDERTYALDETEAALRRIREHMVPAGKSAPRIRRRFTIVSGMGIAAALAVVALEVQLGVLHAPGWLGF